MAGMNFRLPLVLVTIFLSITATTASASCSGALGDAYNRRIDSRPVDQNLFNSAVLFYTNKIRCRRGLRQFTSTDGVFQAAVTAATGMASTRTYSHEIPRRGIRTLRDRLRRHNAEFRTAGENIAFNFLFVLNGRRYIESSSCNFRYQANGQQIPMHTYNSLALELVDGWENSSKHYENIINRRYTSMGAGMGLDRNGQLCGTIYISQVFSG